MSFVGFDYALHERVAHDVLFAKLDASDARHILEHMQSLYQTRLHRAREVNLRSITCDNHLGIHAEAREKHLDLMYCRVLRLVEHNHGIVERAATHKRQRSYLYDIGLHILFEFHGRYHILESIIERLQIGVNLCLLYTSDAADEQ